MIETEAQVVGVLYHEAGHYYQAHASTGVDLHGQARERRAMHIAHRHDQIRSGGRALLGRDGSWDKQHNHATYERSQKCGEQSVDH